MVGDTLIISKHEFFKSSKDTSAYKKINYPQISGLENKRVQNKINSFLYSNL